MNETHKRDIKYSSDNGHPWEEGSKVDLAETVSRPMQPQPDYNLGEKIYGRSLVWYKNAAVWPMFILLFLEISLRVVQTKFLPLVPDAIFSQSLNILRPVIFIYLTVSAIKTFQATAKQAMAAAVLGGVATGLLLAIFQLLWYFELWTVFNLIGQPLLLAAEGLMVSWLVAGIFFKKHNN